ncbi:VWA domain-containing protein [Venatoribacter cucullus]|uniref:VWA domain-containing protein n=1 Tax=Venatoribacter cucullus TaxID=2661630 RepID=UPI00223EF4F5|nr:VWA domain-containing protein [Venatoribacter cucullus]UZK03286.1 VWA domain-containing protein [Venatoribacter cucullus]
MNEASIMFSSLLQHPEQLHLLRPWWLLALLPALWPGWRLWQRRAGAGQWRQVIDPQLLPAMLAQEPQRQASRQHYLWLLSWCLAVLALAGPAWQKLPQPVVKNDHALVIMLDLSASMYAQDVRPSRLVKAQLKVTDIVRARRDGLTALVVYAADAYKVVPLTDDTRTIESLLPSLSPGMMPAPGSRPEKAIRLAQEMTHSAGLHQADLLLLTDGLQEQDVARIKTALQPGFRLRLLTLGTTDGAPIPLPGGGFLHDNNGQIVMPGFDPEPVLQLSRELNIPWQSMTLDDSDWQQLLPARQQVSSGSNSLRREYDQWKDGGFWLLLLLLVPALLLFRRGVLLCLPLLVLLTPSEPVWAAGWQDLWQTRDQQGAALFEQDPAAAAQRFNDPAWRGSAAYRAGDFPGAASAFAQAPASAENLYNLGNALAQNGQLQEALQAYDQALELRPDLSAAQRNRAKVEELLQQQEQQQQPSGDNQSGDNQSGDNQSGENQSGDNQSGDNQSGDNQSGDNQSGDNQSGDNQSGDNQSGDNQSGDNQSGENQSGDNQSGQSQADDEFARQQADKLARQQQEQEQQDATAKQPQEAAADGEGKDKPSGQQPAPGSPDPQSPGEATDLSAAAEQGLSREEQAAMDQWLQSVPDQPGNLLQRKFLYQYRQQPRLRESVQGEVEW